MGRKIFDRQFKIAAVKLVLDDKISVAQVAKELSIHCKSVYRWICELVAETELLLPVHPQ